ILDGTEIYKTYLDPRIGFLHSTNFRRFSLNLDIAEIFKPIIVDRLIFTLVNRNMLSHKHFEKLTDGILLNEEGRKLFVSELEKKMQTTVQHRHLGKSVSYRRLIRLELYKVQKHLLGEKTYEPYAARW
ncbi:CRISPR-associated endonuclease Cas1, partial [Geobacillus thermodenitrificans]